MSAPDVIAYGQACQSFCEPAAATADSPAISVENPSTALLEETRNAAPESTDVRLETASSAELHFPELEGESSEDSCCELLTSLRVFLERTCTREPAWAEQQQGEQAAYDKGSSRPSPFHGSRVPTISLGAYIQRISRYSKCSNICFIMAYSYMQRLAKANSLLRPCAQNAHRLLITAVLLSAKLMDDNIYNNSYWAKIGGVSTAELSAMELAMAQQLDYRLFVGEEEVAHRLRELKVLSRGSYDAGAVQRRPKIAAH